jgi:enoyl-CoA hydratase
MTYQHILVETRDRVGFIRLNRPQHEWLNDALAAELKQALALFDADAGIGAMVITGNDKVRGGRDISGRMGLSEGLHRQYIGRDGRQCGRRASR